MAPLRSMIRHALLTGQPGSFKVLFSARTPGDFPYLPELRGMARRGDVELSLTATRDVTERWRRPRARDPDAAQRTHRSSRHALFYLRACIDGGGGARDAAGTWSRSPADQRGTTVRRGAGHRLVPWPATGRVPLRLDLQR
ncbi:MAG: hypothetical protein LC804_14430 [Acidobacteria bacterium]|nr:hypothetical protein [Acidobacteriota bacterium]